MSDLYIQESALRLSLFSDKIIIKSQDGEIVKEMSLSKVDNVLVFGDAQLTTQLIRRLSKEKINVYYFTKYGQFLSHIESYRMSDFEKQHQQAKMSFNADFNLVIAKKIALAKVGHQVNLLSAYDEDGILYKDDYLRFEGCAKGIERAQTIQEIMGFEGRFAKSYFYYLNLLVPEGFHFRGRSRRPARDPFNALLNYGYGILYSFFIGMIKKHGLSLGFGPIHRPHGSHATLASDLMEEWRPIIVDDTVMRLLKHKEINTDMFREDEQIGFMLTDEGRKIFAQEMQQRMLEIHDYVAYDKKRYTFPYMVEMQILSLIRAYNDENPELYMVSDSSKD